MTVILIASPLMTKDFIVFVPCYNEEEAIHPMASEFLILSEQLKTRNINLRAIFIDDHSSDSTKEKINEVLSQNSNLFSLHHHEKNKGLVGVLESFLVLAQNENKAKVLGFGLLDGDNSHPVSNFVPMIDKILLGYDVVIASRFQYGSIIKGVPYSRQILSVGMSYLFRFFGRIQNVRDYSCGYRAYSTNIISDLGEYRFKYRSFACMVELLVALKKKKALMVEVPFILRYDKKLSSSKMQIVRTIAQTIKVLLK